ncbi:hypothetical protein ACP4OV_024177 [Aristida adscensionis]
MASKGGTAAAMALEVTVVSGEGVVLPSGRALGGGAYAVVHTPSFAAVTRVDEDGDCNGYPHWGETVRVSLPAGARGLDVEICRARRGGGGGVRSSESVAAARVPVEDFTVGPPGHLHCLSYRLFDAATGVRRRNGVVNITVRRVDGGGGGSRAPAPGKKAAMPATGKKAACAGPGTSGSCCGVAAVEHGKAAAPAGTVMGFPSGSPRRLGTPAAARGVRRSIRCQVYCWFSGPCLI